jgi:hypothetical protein
VLCASASSLATARARSRTGMALLAVVYASQVFASAARALVLLSSNAFCAFCKAVRALLMSMLALYSLSLMSRSSVTLYNAAYICFDLPNIWKRAVGSPAGDGFMTEDSQDFLSLNVGGQKGKTTRIRQGHHAGKTYGEVNATDTAAAIIDMQIRLAQQ